MGNLQILVLAAGGSSRMGEPKQLLKWGSNTLIEHQLKILLKTNHPVSVILGAHASQIIEDVKKLSVSCFTHQDWKQGMGTSIAYGVKKLLDDSPETKGILISLIDQPLLTTAYFIKIINHFEPERQQIIASKSDNGWMGAPVLFDKCYFDELLKLKDDLGAKTVIKKHRKSVLLIDGGTLLRDIDTPQAYLDLLKSSFNQ